MRYFLRLSYNGTNYHGWQIQKNATGIQQVFNEKLSLLLGEDIYCVGCGRTDTGVHARMFYLHFDCEKELPLHFLHRLNSFLPKDIAVQEVLEANDPEAHSRWSAVERTYKYFISIGKSPLVLGYAAILHKEPNIEKMRQASEILLQYHDFEAFSKRSEHEEHHLVNMYDVSWKKKGNRLVFTITANRFLRGMVRIVVGSLLYVGWGKMSVEDFKTLIESKDRSKAGPAAPAEGLYLWDIKYPEGMLKAIETGDRGQGTELPRSPQPSEG